jgi:hypothetical protein
MAFHALLIRLHFTNAQATAIIDQGIDSPEELKTYTHSDLKDFFKHLTATGTVTRFGSQHKLQILRYWVETRDGMGLPVDSALFTNAVLTQWGNKMKADAVGKGDKEELVVQECKPFKKTTKWRVWKEQFKTKLASKKGRSKLPLGYVVCPNDVPERGL